MANKKKASKKQISKKEKKQVQIYAVVFVVLAIIIIAVATIESISENAPDRAVYGNDISNVANGGHVVDVGDSTYYSNIGIWVKPDDGKAYELTDQRAAAMSVYGDYIYFCNISDNNRCYKIRLDGSGMEKVTDFSVDYINIVDDKIFFVCNKETATRGVFSMNPDGTELEQISDKLVAAMVAYKDRLFYIDKDMNNRLYSMNHRGKDIKRITDDFVYCVTTDGEELICSTTEGLYRMNWKGYYETKIGDISPTSLLVADDQLFYSCYSYTGDADNLGIYRCDALTGENVEQIREDQSMFLATGGGKLYFKSIEEGMVVMRCNFDGSEGTFTAGGEASGMLSGLDLS